MSARSSILVSEDDARTIHEAVLSGEFASSVEVVHAALESWKLNQTLGRLWDIGIASGPADPDETMDDIKAEARRRLSGR